MYEGFRHSSDCSALYFDRRHHWGVGWGCFRYRPQRNQSRYYCRWNRSLCIPSAEEVWFWLERRFMSWAFCKARWLNAVSVTGPRSATQISALPGGHPNKSFQPTKPFVTALADARSAPNTFAGESNVRPQQMQCRSRMSPIYPKAVVRDKLVRAAATDPKLSVSRRVELVCNT